MNLQSELQRLWQKTGQLGMFDVPVAPIAVQPLKHMLVWNIGNPSSSRANAQLDWLRDQGSELIVLTEAAQSEGCEELQEGLAKAGYLVVASIPQKREYGSIVASKSGAIPSDFVNRLKHLPHRVVSIYLESEAIEVIGVYVPSRDGKLSRSDVTEAVKSERKRSFLDSFIQTLASSPSGSKIVCGDFNVIPRNHIPPEAAFQSWEYDFLSGLETLGLTDTFTLHDANRQDHSWFGYFGDRYRFDYCYVSRSLAQRIKDASFDHSPRLLKLSDHSALRVQFLS